MRAPLCLAAKRFSHPPPSILHPRRPPRFSILDPLPSILGHQPISIIPRRREFGKKNLMPFRRDWENTFQILRILSRSGAVQVWIPVKRRERERHLSSAALGRLSRIADRTTLDGTNPFGSPSWSRRLGKMSHQRRATSSSDQAATTSGRLRTDDVQMIAQHGKSQDIDAELSRQELDAILDPLPAMFVILAGHPRRCRTGTIVGRNG